MACGQACHGNGAEHCCHIAGHVCPHLEEHTVEGRRWACGLRRRLGSWEAVHESPEYRRDVEPYWLRTFAGKGCGDFPQRIAEIMSNPAMGRCCFEA